MVVLAGHVLVRLVPGRGLIWVLNHLLVRPDSPRSAELRQLFQLLREVGFGEPVRGIYASPAS